ncbi:protein EARLY FLOWERING 4 [Nicotiana tabacum]|uniref:Protein EARLY FLOWERING 4 n=1 Tax=Nicotiana tabacum TaxID=4097 RepID=A0A1S3Z805_TOBAC|nr:PREDICTED: protein EARLY FLOWERING 4-like [Nicotiana tabacum]
MEDSSNLNRHRQSLEKCRSRNSAATTNNCRSHQYRDDDFSIEKGDSETWNSFSNKYRQVQSVLDRNRLLIQQVNENHQSRTHNSMVQNVGLIQELNGNISKVASLYSDFNTDFRTMVHQRKNGV